MSEVRLDGISKSFGRHLVVRDIDLSIAEGQFCVILGPSGCGKSTLLRLIAGLENPTSGRIHIGGTDVTRLPPKQRSVAMVFQSYALYPHMSAYENMAFGLRLSRKQGKEVDRRIREAARTLHIEHLLGRKPAQLSGGQQQRVAIGRAIVREPSVFLFDEPLSNLDADLRARMRGEFVNLHRRLGNTMVYVTHDQTEAMTLADRLVLINEGRMLQSGPPMTLYRNPQTLFAATFLGSPRINLLSGILIQFAQGTATVQLADGSQLKAAVSVSDVSPGTPVSLGIRPEALGLHGTETNSIKGTVSLVEQLGDHALVHMDWHETADAIVMRTEGNDLPRVGERLEPTFTPEACYLFTQDGRAFARIEQSARGRA